MGKAKNYTKRKNIFDWNPLFKFSPKSSKTIPSCWVDIIFLSRKLWDFFKKQFCYLEIIFSLLKPYILYISRDQSFLIAKISENMI